MKEKNKLVKNKKQIKFKEELKENSKNYMRLLIKFKMKN